MSIKIAFFDIDNTLYDWSTHAWIQSALDSIKKLQKKGIKVFICSARPFQSIKEFGAYNLGVKWDGYISSCGAVAYYKKRYIEKSIMPVSMVRAILKMAKDRGCVMEIVGLKSRNVSGPANEYVDIYHQSFRDPWRPIIAYKGTPVTSLLFFGPEKFDQDFIKAFPSISWFRFNECGVDVSHEPHHKGNAIRKVMEYFGYKPEEGIAFGDEMQDMTMKGPVANFVCVGNGREEVKAIADYVSPKIIDDGIKIALEHYGLI